MCRTQQNSTPRKLSMKQKNAWKINTHPLYSEPCRVAIWVMLGLLMASDSILFVISLCVFGFGADWWVELGKVTPDPSVTCSSFFIWNGVPIVALISSVVQTIYRGRRTLASWVVVSSSCILCCLWVLWAFAGELDMYLKSTSAKSWYDYDASDAYWVSWTAAAGCLMNILYMIFGCIAVHRERHQVRDALVLSKSRAFLMEEEDNENETYPTWTPPVEAKATNVDAKTPSKSSSPSKADWV